MSQASVAKAMCDGCKVFAAGQIVVGGFLCEECLRVFIIQHQLWRVPVNDRNRIIFEDGLKL